MAQIAINLIIFAFAMGVLYTMRIATLARQRKTRWRIHLINGVRSWKRVETGWMGESEVIERSVIVWDTTLPPEIAIHHLPMVGTKWGDAIVESVGSEELS